MTVESMDLETLKTELLILLGDFTAVSDGWDKYLREKIGERIQLLTLELRNRNQHREEVRKLA